jgi:hypothetical protein
VPAAAFSRSPPPDREYDASDAWLVDLVTAALTLVRAVAAESESVAAALLALEASVSWEGPAARDFRRRAGGLSADGTASSAALDALVADIRALRNRVWTLTEEAPRA